MNESIERRRPTVDDSMERLENAMSDLSERINNLGGRLEGAHLLYPQVPSPEKSGKDVEVEKPAGIVLRIDEDAKKIRVMIGMVDDILTRIAIE